MKHREIFIEQLEALKTRAENVTASYLPKNLGITLIILLKEILEDDRGV